MQLTLLVRKDDLAIFGDWNGNFILGSYATWSTIYPIVEPQHVRGWEVWLPGWSEDFLAGHVRWPPPIDVDALIDGALRAVAAGPGHRVTVRDYIEPPPVPRKLELRQHVISHGVSGMRVNCAFDPVSKAWFVYTEKG